MNQDRTGPEDQDRAPALEESWAIITEQQQRVRDTLRVDDRVVYTTWGVAWGVGYLAMFASADGANGRPGTAGAITFGLLITAAIAVTIVHAVLRTGGMGGRQARMDAMLGAAWSVGFLAVFAVFAGVGRAGFDGPAAGIVYNALPCLVVAGNFMGAGAAWDDRRQFRLGVWIAAVVAAASLVGGRELYLVMAVLGGGGFLVAAALDVRARRRRAS